MQRAKFQLNIRTSDVIPRPEIKTAHVLRKKAFDFETKKEKTVQIISLNYVGRLNFIIFSEHSSQSD